jgi:hypothetical protein
MNLAYGAYEAMLKKQDKSFAAEGIDFAKQTLSLFEAGKLPTIYEPFKTQADATGVMYYVIGNLSLDTDLKQTAGSLFKSFQYESQIKNNAHSYYLVAFYYEKEYEKAAKDFSAKHGAKTTEDNAMIADMDKLNAIVDKMMDAYARAIHFATDKDANKDAWQTRLTQVYQYRKQSDKGLAEFLANITATPMIDPSK